MSQLNGQPRLAGIIRRYASSGGPITDDWDDQSTYVETQGRKLRRGPARLWPSWALTIVATETEWLAWRSDLRGDEDGEFDWVPRTRRVGDPDWLEEHVYRARVQGGLRTLTPVRQRNTRDELVYVVDVVIEGVEPYEREPDAVSGGFTLVSEGELDGQPIYTVGTYGDATLADGPSYPVVFTDYDGFAETVVVESVTLGTPAIAAARTLDLGDSIRIYTASPS